MLAARTAPREIFRLASRSAARENERGGEYPPDLVDVVVFSAALALCMWALRDGGLAAIGASFIGAMFGVQRPGTVRLRAIRAFRYAFASLWAGAMLIGMLSFGLAL